MKNKKKEIRKYNKLLQSYIDNKEIVKIERGFADAESCINGFLLDLSKDFILLQNADDFKLNGYSIIPRGRFDSIRNNKFDKTQKKILKKEGIIKSQYGIKKEIDISNWESIFYSLKKLKFNIIVECEEMDEPIFLIGPIKKINKNSVSIQYFDAAGILDNKPTKVKYSDITIVRFDERYINVFSKHVRKKKK